MRNKGSTATIIGLLFGMALVPALAMAQATLLPNAKQQYLDDSGTPLASGQVFYYTPNTSTLKNVWTDAAQTTLSPNPVQLDAAGRPMPTGQTFGSGSYRQKVVDASNNTIWDAVTTSTGGSSSGGSSTATGDGDLVGTIKPWAGLVAPNQYMFAYGQAISRATYSDLKTAITSSQALICTSGLNVLSGLVDTTQIPIGAKVEATCVPPGVTVTAKTSNSITISANATTTTAVTATIYPFGNGDGATTFNLPDLRGRVISGRSNMGGTAATSVLNSTYYGTGPDAIGAAGGNQSKTLASSDVPGHSHTLSLNDPGHNHTTDARTLPGGATIATGSGVAAGAAVVNSNTTGITITSSANSTGLGNQTNYIGGGIGASANVASAGSGYTNGIQTITISGGTCSTQPQFNVLVVGNVFTNSISVATAGDCTSPPANPASTTGGGGTGGTLNVLYTSRPISLVQPSLTINYIIKVTPDANAATASGVTSLGSMTGSIACGTGLTCTSNTVSVNSIGVADNAVAIGLSGGLVGVTPGASGTGLVSNGPSVPPSFQPVITSSGTSAVGNLAFWNNTTASLLGSAPSYQALNPANSSLYSQIANIPNGYTTIYNALQVSQGTAIGATGQFGRNTVGVQQAIVGTLSIAAGDTAGNAGYGVIGYGETNSANTGVVGIGGVGTCGFNNSNCWASNFSVGNSLLGSLAPNTGVDISSMYGAEINVNIMKKAAGAEPTVGNLWGIYVVGGGDSTSTYGIGVAVDKLSVNTNAKWVASFSSQPGASNIAMVAGAVASGASQNSQTVQFNSTDAGSVAKSVSVYGSLNGDFTVSSAAFGTMMSLTNAGGILNLPALTASRLVATDASKNLSSFDAGTTTTVLHGNAGGLPTFGAVVSADLNITTTSCTNQFVSAISSGGVGTCSTVSASNVTGTLTPDHGGTGVANNAASTLTISGAFATTLTVTGATSVTLPTTGTLATLAGAEELTNKTLTSAVAKGTWTPDGTTPWTFNYGSAAQGLWIHSATGSWSPTTTAQTQPFGASAGRGILISANTPDSSPTYTAVGYGVSGGGFRGGASGGSLATPTASTAGQLLSYMGGHGYDGSAWTTGTKALLAFTATSLWSASNNETHITLETVPNGSTTRAMALRAHGSTGVSIATTTDPGAGALLTNTFVQATTYLQAGTKLRSVGPAPALSSCGTSPTIEGSDLSGTVTMGTGSPTGCIITFNAAYSNAPRCSVTWRTNIASMQYTVSTTAITLTQTATSSNMIDYICTARSGG